MKEKIIKIVIQNNDLWALTDKGRIYIRKIDGSWEDLTEKFYD